MEAGTPYRLVQCQCVGEYITRIVEEAVFIRKTKDTLTVVLFQLNMTNVFVTTPSSPPVQGLRPSFSAHILCYHNSLFYPLPFLSSS